MNRSVNVFIAVILCAVLCGILIWLSSSSEEATWNPNDIYDEVHGAQVGGSSHTNASFAMPSSTEGGLALTLSSSSSVFRHGAASFYAGASSSPSSIPSLQGGAGGRLIPSLQGGAGGGLSSGAGLYMTSSAEMKSFGGGGNGGAAMGGGMRGASSSSSLIASSPIASISSPISYSSGSRGSMNISGDNPVQMVADNPALAMASAANMDYTTFGNPAAGFYNDYTNGTNGNMGGGRSGIRGRQNAMGFNTAWWVWFDNWVQNNGSDYQGEDDGYYFDQYQLRTVYDKFIASYWNSGMGEAPSFEEWLDWYQSAMLNENGYYTYNEHNYYWVPVGDILPLLLLALLYIALVSLRSLRPLKSR